MAAFRNTLLCRLKERDGRCDKFSRVVKAHEELLESFNHILSSRVIENDVNVKEYALGIIDLYIRKHVFAYVFRSDESLTEREMLEAELSFVNSELSDTYKKKAQNDQRLIETNESIMRLEQQISNITKERDNLFKQVEAAAAELRIIDKEAYKKQQDNETIHDECIASEFLLNATKDKLQAAEEERKELRIRVEQMKLQMRN